MTGDFTADELIEAAEEDPEYIIDRLAIRWNREGFTANDLLHDARALAEHGVNLFEILDNHPEAVDDRFGSELEFDELISRFDRMADRSD